MIFYYIFELFNERLLLLFAVYIVFYKHVELFIITNECLSLFFIFYNMI